MYTHARQFPHCGGLSDSEIRQLFARALSRHPGLIRAMRWRNVVIVWFMVISVAILARFSELRISYILVMVGGLATGAIMAWNLVWVNTVVFRLTRQEIERGIAPNKSMQGSADGPPDA